MIKILVASAEAKNNQNFCQLLANDKKFFIYNALTVNDALNKYTLMQPHILIIGSSLGVSNCINIINKISSLPIATNKCYTIIVSSLDETNAIIKQLNNLSMIYRILYKPLDITEALATINEIAPILSIKELTFDDIRYLLLLLNISVSSKGANYLMASIIACYYFPFLLENVENDVFVKIAEYYNTTRDRVRENIRSTLSSLDNRYIDRCAFPLFKLFDFKLISNNKTST